jgi:hypothetical protein
LGRVDELPCVDCANEYVLGLRAVTSTDGMTADLYSLNMSFLSATVTRIIIVVKGVNPCDLRHHVKAAGDDRVGARDRLSTKLRAAKKEKTGELRIGSRR